ncbi:MAG TPA: hypothetical protein VNT81_00850 [Vicinamibacterales bacterium]|nr:hypothetical protein [Vicinamibacterales bacterium]
MTERDGDREHARPVPCGYAIQIAHQLREEIVGIELLDDQLQKCTRPGELRRAFRERTDCARAKLLPPSLGLVLLLCPCGCFQVTIDVDDGVTDLAHGSSDWQRANTRVPVSAEGLGSPRCYGGCEWVRGDVRA